MTEIVAEIELIKMQEFSSAARSKCIFLSCAKWWHAKWLEMEIVICCASQTQTFYNMVLPPSSNHINRSLYKVDAALVKKTSTLVVEQNGFN